MLRPGGQELTHEMLKAMNITSDDDVIEFAPGLGYTAKLALSHQPHSYVAVELNAEAAKRVNSLPPGRNTFLPNFASTQ